MRSISKVGDGNRRNLEPDTAIPGDLGGIATS